MYQFGFGCMLQTYEVSCRYLGLHSYTFLEGMVTLEKIISGTSVVQLEQSVRCVYVCVFRQ